jgi:broad-specificity NMP kinase
MLIVFGGLPGGGKTTLSQAIAAVDTAWVAPEDASAAIAANKG